MEDSFAASLEVKKSPSETRDDGIAKSGHRPRFKRRPRREMLSGDTRCRGERVASGDEEEKAALAMRITGGRLQVAAVTHQVQVSHRHPQSAPKHQTVKLIRVTNKWNPAKHVLFIAMIISASTLTSSVVKCDLVRRQTNRHEQPGADQQQQQQLALNQTERLTGEESLKVAALAGRLAQWFACRRATHLANSQMQTTHLQHQSPDEHAVAGEPAPVTQAAAAAANVATYHPASRLHLQRRSGPAGGCPAHYDGHLCWPAAAADETVQLRCPDLLPMPAAAAPPLASNGDKSRAAASSYMSQPVIESGHQLIQAAAPAALLAAAAAANIETNLSGEQMTTSAPSVLESIKTNGDGPIIQVPAQDLRLASRKCQVSAGDGDTSAASGAKRLEQGQDTAVSNLTGASAQWQTDADYSACWPGNGAQFDPTDKWIKLDQEPDRRLFAILADELDRIETTIDPYSDPDWLEQWTLCIGNIMRHQRAQLTGRQADDAATAGDAWCPIIFDGWRCWPTTRASGTAYVSCPSNQPGFSAERKAHKVCTQDGTWYRHPMTNRYWSNYTTCVDTVDLAFRTKILNLYVIGNIISLIALLASLIIFVSFKSLSCTRVTIHKNLFLSFITNNLMWIVWYTCVVNDADLLQSNPIECQLWHILLHYFLVSNYFWMFCEGLYLYTLLELAFVSENKILKWFYLLGWLTPVPITIAYAYQRFQDQDYTQFCWMEESPYNQILVYPIVISLVLNFVFLINIVRVLVNKLKANNNNAPDTHQTRKAVRATLILIPLLGLHYLLTPMRPEPKSEWEVIYESIAAVCTSFQGLCVAMLFCFCNGEVISVIRRKLRDSFKFHSRFGAPPMRSRSNTTCTTTAAFGYFSPQAGAGAAVGTTQMSMATNNYRASNGSPKPTNNGSAADHRSPPVAAATGPIMNGEPLVADRPANHSVSTTTTSNNSDCSQRESDHSSSAFTSITAMPVVARKTLLGAQVDLIDGTTNGFTLTSSNGTQSCGDDLTKPLLATATLKCNSNPNNNGETIGLLLPSEQ